MGIFKRINREERGISAVIAVISLLGIFGAAMLSLDAGNMWQTRRNIIIGTDSTALDQAKNLAFAPSTGACPDSWRDYMFRNSGGGTGVDPISCVSHASSDGTGYVVVEGRKEATTRFGGLFGIGNTSPYSLSAAQWGFVSEARGLRPMGFCDQNSHVQTWLDLQDGTISETQYNNLRGAGDVNGDEKIDYPADLRAEWGVVHRMYFNNDVDDGQCGSFPGNWGWLSFDGLPSNTGDLNGWIVNGYDEGVRIREDGEPACEGQPGSGDETDTAEGCVPGDSGALANQNASSLDQILHKPIHIMIFDTGDCQGGGVTCTFESWGFLGVTLRRYQATGAQAERYFDFEFSEIVVSGVCCSGGPPNGADTGIRGIKLCAVDHDTSGATVARRCSVRAS